MAKFSVTIRPSEKRADGTCNIKILVTHKGEGRYIATKYNVIPEYFDFDTGTVRVAGPYSQAEAYKINNKVLIQRGVLAAKADQQRNVDNMLMRALMDLLRDRHLEMDFFAILEKRLAKLKKEGNVNYHNSFLYTKSLLTEFYRSPILPFDAIDYSFLSRLEEYMKDYRKLTPSSVGIYMRNIRTIFNEARKMNLVDYQHNPFSRYSIPKGEARENIVLTPGEMAAVAKIEIKEPLMRWARDIAMLSFCLVGINPKDLFEAKEIKGGRLMYIRSKGKKKYSIKVPPQALHIIKRYPGKKYLLDTLDRYADYRSATKRIDYKLKDIAALCRIDKRVVIYTFRHSWSAYARYLGVSKDDIAAALGHRQIDLPCVTEFYDHIEEEQRRVDQANRKVIRLILETKPKSRQEEEVLQGRPFGNKPRGK